MAVKKQFRILALDGGGIRGIIPALILAEIEKRTGKRISEMFDLIAGTSTGGILGLGLTTPDKEGNPLYSAQQLSELYEKNGNRIFSVGMWKKIKSAGGLLDEKFSQKGIEEVLLEYFGDVRISQALTEVLVISYDLETRKPFFFKSRKAKQESNRDFLIREACRATSAAPTYFEPLKLNKINEAGYYSLVDGGVFANNPSMCAFAEACEMGFNDLFVVSLGTGETDRPYSHDKAKNWGMAEWIKPVIAVMMDGNSDTTSYQMAQVIKANPSSDYFRIQTQLTKETQEMDNAESDNIERLKVLADQLIDEQSFKIGDICDRLMNSGKEIA